MFNIKSKFFFKKASMLLISLSIMFTMVTPSFACAMKRPLITSNIIVYDVFTKKFKEYTGEIFDYNDEYVQWDLGTEQILATIEIANGYIYNVEVPVDSFDFISKKSKVTGKPRKVQKVIINKSLKHWLKENMKDLLDGYSCKEARIEISTRISGKVDGVWYNLECRLAVVIIINTENV
ncbi:MAG: hypothetical protein RUMPE_00274 [Eubacteriales bacterium SKADARSKE-1]|nr:hypothetical protein [Eubacteriales bacterium SKADARSKE-1]